MIHDQVGMSRDRWMSPKCAQRATAYSTAAMMKVMERGAVSFMALSPGSDAGGPYPIRG